ncbi:MAG: nucleoside-diphosphate kinase [Candidatus Cloacimonadota bacterium]|nr:MAG: nucleoside-diphosphate kinase [Candidatus Cloacimonadota bacterium]
MAVEQTYTMVKPDGVQRQLVGEIIARFENKGLKLAGLKITQISKEKAEIHYGEHKERPFFGELVDFITSGPVVAMVWEGEGAIAISRTLMGATKAEEAAPGTIRGDYALYTGKNLVHGSDSTESAKREIGIFFDESELVSYNLDAAAWIV